MSLNALDREGMEEGREMAISMSYKWVHYARDAIGGLADVAAKEDRVTCFGGLEGNC